MLASSLMLNTEAVPPNAAGTYAHLPGQPYLPFTHQAEEDQVDQEGLSPVSVYV